MWKVVGTVAALFIGTAGAASEFWMLHESEVWSTRVTKMDSGLECVVTGVTADGSMSLYGSANTITGVYGINHLKNMPEMKITTTIQIDSVEPWTGDFEHTGDGYFVIDLSSTSSLLVEELIAGKNIHVLDITIPLGGFNEALLHFSRCLTNLDKGQAG